MKSVLFLIKKELFYTTLNHHTRVWAILSFLSTLLGVFFLIVIIAVINGMQTHFKKILKGDFPDITIQYHPQTISSPHNQANFVQALESVKTSFPLIQADAVCLSSNKRIIPLRIHGIFNQEAESIIGSSIISSPNRKNKLPQNMNEAIINEKTAQLNGWELNDTINLIFPKIEPSNNDPLSLIEWPMKIVGFYQSKNEHLPYLWTLIDLKQLNQISTPTIEYSTYIYLKKDKDIKSAIKLISDIIRPPDQLIPWYEWHHDIHSAFRLEKLVSSLLLSIVFIIVMYNISSTLMLNLMEKKKDIALYKALGCSKKNILGVFIIKGLLLGGNGIIIGTTLALLTCWLMNTYHIIPLPQSVYYIDYLPAQIHLNETFYIIISSFAICCLFSLYPAFQASKLNIIETLRRD